MTATARNGAAGAHAGAPPTPTRVAVYTRKSVATGFEQEFSSIDAQRQAVEAYVESQRGAGWIVLERRYDDGGFSGATTDRPAFQRLLADVEAGLVDCVGVYRIDRLSRSFADYVAILKLFERRGVRFFSVNEQFNTTTPTGRLVLNQLILFSQFEREVTAERIRDKVRASRRRGMWTGGRPVLGYDVVDRQLVVNEDEAHQVREAFALYLERGSLRAAVAELRRRGWRNKGHTSRAGNHVEGRAFTKASLQRLLTNVLYRGQVRCGDDVVDGAHEAIVDAQTWEAVQERLRGNGAHGGSRARNDTGALLRGLVRCGRCGGAMVHTFTSKRGRRYRYYECSRRRDEGPEGCEGARVPAGEFEAFVADRVRAVGRDGRLAAEAAAAADARAGEARERLDAERRRLEGERRRLVRQEAPGSGNEGHLAEVDARLAEVRAEREALRGGVDGDDLREALAAFDPVWDELFPRERERVLRLLLERVTYDPDDGDVELELRPCGVEALAAEARGEQ